MITNQNWSPYQGVGQWRVIPSLKLQQCTTQVYHAPFSWHAYLYRDSTLTTWLSGPRGNLYMAQIPNPVTIHEVSRHERVSWLTSVLFQQQNLQWFGWSRLMVRIKKHHTENYIYTQWITIIYLKWWRFSSYGKISFLPKKITRIQSVA